MRRATTKEVKKGKPVRFQIKAKPGSQVSVAGTFNNWDPQTHPLKGNPKSGIFTATIELPAGRHEYKFVINGKWCEDPASADYVLNQYGTKNSLICV